MNTPTSPILIPVILCGGAGSRLWPVSRTLHPKPFIRLDDGESFLQKAFLRGVSLPKVSEIITVTNRELFFKVEDEYEKISQLYEGTVSTHFILEPFGRNTAPAIAAATLQVAQAHGESATLLVLAADHLITNQQKFAQSVTKACDLASNGKLVTFGIQPTIPETSYGYIESNDCEIIRFIEKPSLDKAEQYYNSGHFLWNSGIFCFTAGTMLQEMTKHCPTILKATENCLQNAKKSAGEEFSQLEIRPKDFDDMPNDSIDYAVMEKTSNAVVVPCDIGWSDLGCWRAFDDLLPPDSNNNRIEGDVLIRDSTNCTIKANGRMVGAVGIENLIIIDTSDALLVINKSRSQEVKHIYEDLKAQGHKTHKLHPTVHRPWGSYTILKEEPHFKIKRIEVKPKGRLSLQTHRHRSEHWVIVSGTAKVQNNDQELILTANESTYISATHKHRLENIGLDQLVLIEVQIGDYLGEDDIVRLDDVYGRASHEQQYVRVTT